MSAIIIILWDCFKFLLRLIIKLRLLIPLILVFLACTVLSDFFHAHPILDDVVFYGMIICWALSWVITLYKYSKRVYEQKIIEKKIKQLEKENKL